MPDILIIDDREQWREIITEAADGLYICDEASEFNGAVGKISEGDYSLICLNYGFHTDYKGRKLLILLREKYPDVPVVLITGAFVGDFDNIISKLSELQNNFHNIKAILIKGYESLDFIGELIKTFDKLVGRRKSCSISSVPSEKKDNIFSWLHFSDLHFGCKQKKDSNLLSEAILKDVQEHQLPVEKQENYLAKVMFQPNIVVITGDIAYHGLPEEYEEAEQFLMKIWEITGLDRDCTLVVPGNHDVFREAVENDPLHDVIYKELAEDQKSTEDWRGVLSKWWDYTIFDGVVEKKFKNYLEFSRKVSSAPYGNKLFYSKLFEIDEYSIEVLGFNSALISCKDGEDRNRDLWIGIQQIDELKRAAKEASVRVALLHHPQEALHVHDGAWEMLKKYCDIILHGHMHDMRAISSGEPEKEHICLPGGAVNEGGKWKHQRYSFGQINLEKKEIALYMRMTTSGDDPMYVRDNQTYPKAAPEGHLTMPLFLKK